MLKTMRSLIKTWSLRLRASRAADDSMDPLDFKEEEPEFDGPGYDERAAVQETTHCIDCIGNTAVQGTPEQIHSIVAPQRVV